MRGEVLEAGPGGGLIGSAESGRYRFAAAEWCGAMPALTGMAVDFVGEGEIARAVYPLPQQPVRSGVAATPPGEVGNSVLLGVLGIACLVLSFGVPFLIFAALVLGLVGAGSGKRYRNSTGLTLSRIAWIGSVVLLGLLVALIAFAMTFAWPLLDLIWQYVMYVAQHPQTVV